ncbi:MAG: hypothetical protein KAI63_05360, partial [Planctomycetes bacterium]|nr:hypothetical protein [Planctomycetota bacterium]
MEKQVETLEKKIATLKAKVTEADKSEKPSPELRALGKSLRRAQRKVRSLTGKKLKAATGAKDEEATPAAAAKPAVEPKKE